MDRYSAYQREGSGEDSYQCVYVSVTVKNWESHITLEVVLLCWISSPPVVGMRLQAKWRRSLYQWWYSARPRVWCDFSNFFFRDHTHIHTQVCVSIWSLTSAPFIILTIVILLLFISFYKLYFGLADSVKKSWRDFDHVCLFNLFFFCLFSYKQFHNWTGLPTKSGTAVDIMFALHFHTCVVQQLATTIATNVWSDWSWLFGCVVCAMLRPPIISPSNCTYCDDVQYHGTTLSVILLLYNSSRNFTSAIRQ